MDLWNRSLVAVTAVLAALLLAALGVTALLNRYPTTRDVPTTTADDFPGRSSITRLPRSAPLEVRRLRRRADYLGQELAKRNAVIQELTEEIKRLERQVRRLREERDASVSSIGSVGFEVDELFASDLMSDSMVEAYLDAGSDEDALGEPPPEEEAADSQLPPARAPRSLEAELEALRGLLDDWQLQADAELVELQATHDQLLASIQAALVRIGPPAVPGLIAALESPHIETRIWAAETLRALGTDAEAATAALELSRSDADPDVRAAVEDALAAIRN